MTNQTTDAAVERALEHAKSVNTTPQECLDILITVDLARRVPALTLRAEQAEQKLADEQRKVERLERRIMSLVSAASGEVGE